MASIFLKDPVYITVQEVIDSTSKPALAALTSDEIKILITKAQREVNAYICRTFRPSVDVDQDYLFPVLKEEVSYLPEELTEATLYVVEQVFVSGDTVNTTNPWITLKMEKLWPRSYEYERETAIWVLIPDIAKKLLEKFKNRFLGQKI